MTTTRNIAQQASSLASRMAVYINNGWPASVDSDAMYDRLDAMLDQIDDEAVVIQILALMD